MASKQTERLNMDGSRFYVRAQCDECGRWSSIEIPDGAVDRACRAHAALVAALEDCVLTASRDEHGREKGTLHADHYARIRSALALAREAK